MRKTIEVYSFNPETFEFTGVTTAEESPLEKGVFLIPANATDVEPTVSAEQNEVLVFENGAWVTKPDYRGYEYWDADANHFKIEDIGVEPPVGHLTERPVVLEEEKEKKRDEVRMAFFYEHDTPVSDGVIQWHGGFDSALKLDGALRMAQNAGLTEVTFFDVSNTAHTLTVEEANQVIGLVSNKYQTDLAKKHALLNQINNATTLEEVQSIVW